MRHKIYILFYSTILLVATTHCQQPKPDNNPINQTCGEIQPLPASECAAVLDLYEATNGDQWRDSPGRKAFMAEPCFGFGIICTDGHVTKLVMNNNQLQGTIPNSIIELSHLQQIDLSSNNLSGNIPIRIGELNQLEDLFLNHNKLEGLLPNSLGNLAQLKRLRLSNNNFVGPLPSTLTGMSNLEQLWFTNTNLIEPDSPELKQWLRTVQDREWGEAITVAKNIIPFQEINHWEDCYNRSQIEDLMGNAMAELLHHPEAKTLSEEQFPTAFFEATMNRERKIIFPHLVNVTAYRGQEGTILFTVQNHCSPGSHYSTPRILFVYNGRNHYTYLQQIGSQKPQKVYAAPNGWLLLVNYATSSTSGDHNYGVLHVSKLANSDHWSIEEIVYLPFNRTQQDMVLSEDGQELVVTYEETNRQRPCRFDDTLDAQTTETTYAHEQFYQFQPGEYYELLYETADVLQVKTTAPHGGLSTLENWQDFCVSNR